MITNDQANVKNNSLELLEMKKSKLKSKAHGWFSIWDTDRVNWKPDTNSSESNLETKEMENIKDRLKDMGIKIRKIDVPEGKNKENGGELKFLRDKKWEFLKSKKWT